MKPFDLEKALAGEPVMLRDGSKAFVKFETPDYLKEHNFADIVGYKVSGNNFVVKEWDSSGIARFYSPSEDIIEMWQEPQPRVQLDLPAPLKHAEENQIVFKKGSRRIIAFQFLPNIAKHQDFLEAGSLFATKEDAQEWLEAMKGARR